MASEITRNECAHCGQPSGVCICAGPEWVVARYVRAEEPPAPSAEQEQLDLDG